MEYLARGHMEEVEDEIDDEAARIAERARKMIDNM